MSAQESALNRAEAEALAAEPGFRGVRWEWMALIAATLSSAALIPQIVQVVRKQEADQVAIAFILMGLSANVLWLVYASANLIRPVIISASIITVLYITLLVCKLHFDKINFHRYHPDVSGFEAFHSSLANSFKGKPNAVPAAT